MRPPPWAWACGSCSASSTRSPPARASSSPACRPHYLSKSRFARRKRAHGERARGFGEVVVGGALYGWVVTAPHAPWKLLGDCVTGLARRPRGGALPAGLRPLLGPAVVIAARYQESPVGPYSEMVVAEPARLGLRPGLCATTIVVDSPAARVGGRVNWGFPKELGTLLWEREGDERSLRWVERSMV